MEFSNIFFSNKESVFLTCITVWIIFYIVWLVHLHSIGFLFILSESLFDLRFFLGFRIISRFTMATFFKVTDFMTKIAFLVTGRIFILMWIFSSTKLTFLGWWFEWFVRLEFIPITSGGDFVNFLTIVVWIYKIWLWWFFNTQSLYFW